MGSVWLALTPSRRGIEPEPLSHRMHEERMPVLEAARQRLGTDDQGLDGELAPAKDLADPVERATAIPANHEEVNVAALVLVPARERTEHVDRLHAQLRAEPGRERRQLAKEGLTRSRMTEDLNKAMVSAVRETVNFLATQKMVPLSSAWPSCSRAAA